MGGSATSLPAGEERGSPHPSSHRASLQPHAPSPYPWETSGLPVPCRAAPMPTAAREEPSCSLAYRSASSASPPPLYFLFWCLTLARSSSPSGRWKQPGLDVSLQRLPRGGGASPRASLALTPLPTAIPWAEDWGLGWCCALASLATPVPRSPRDAQGPLGWTTPWHGGCLPTHL